MKKVVIIGGGFAGSYLAKCLEKNFEVVLIDTKDYFEFTPGILRTIVEPSHLNKIQVLHTRYLKKANTILEEVKEIGKDYVRIKNNRINFNYLVICSGSGYKTPIKEKNVVIATRAKQLRDCYKSLCKAKDILIIGGGLVGIELAGEVVWKYNDKNITIVQGGDKILERNNDKTIKYAMKFLEKNKVTLILNERVTKNIGKTYITNTGTKLRADMTFLCTGIVPHFEFMKKNFSKNLNERNQIKVNAHLQLIGHKTIFAAGDITDCRDEKTAQNAKRQAKVVCKNLKLLEKEKELVNYEAKQTPLVVSLGKWNGIFTSKNLTFGGLIPALMKGFIELYEMQRKKV